ncbi:serine hydrolase domain-containing protein [Rugamonas aquatica]|uniref:Serine hydrolase n=1 Tax=Rugamonas aquatica TaxID=2743357 RepID=A0A6A7MY32_9BURK|nr:serine hydrolase domain-containing protein [Rugamonas aquatica]MQA37666.1 serine hydrolase [Rugamonas aquatica]
MQRKVLAASILFFSSALAQAQATSPELQRMLSGALKDRSVPAMGVLVIRDGQPQAQAVDGVRAKGSAEHASLQDSWHIGSDAKAMTATLVARLVEQGKLSWDAPLKDMLPLLGMRAEYADVTLADLLSHRAGLPPNSDEKLIEATRKDARPLPVLRMEYAQRALSEAPIGAIRSDARYSNSGFMIAAAIAEHATGKAFEELMQEQVFEPLGMRVDTGQAQRGQLLGHKKGKPLAGPGSDIPPFFAPAGATVRLSMADWSKFLVDQMAGERGHGKLLSQAGYTHLHTPQGDSNSALGWGVKTNWPAQAPIRMLMHAGSNGYWNALVALAPDRQDGVLVVANAGEGTGAEQQQMKLVMTLMSTIAKGQ